MRAHKGRGLGPHVVRCLVSTLLGLTAAIGGCVDRRETAAALPSPQSPAKALAAPVDIAEHLETIRARHQLPALAAVVLREDGIVALGAVGVRKLGSPKGVTANDRFHLGSDTKAMTATLIALLVEEGRLSWDTTLAAALPDLAPTMNADYRGVTVEQLLQHRGGLPADLRRDGLWLRLRTAADTPREQRELLAGTVLSWPPAVPPGSQYLYSNAGYAVAGLIAERITGEAWEDLMRRRLFEPLGMSTAGFGPPGTPGEVDEPRGHATGVLGTSPLEPGPLADNPPAIGPAATVHCSLPDWGEFVRLHLRGARGTAALLRPETFARLHTPPAGAGYAAGWGVLQHPTEGRVLLHAGSNTLWFAQAWVATERGYAILVATNRGGDPAERGTGEAIGELVRWVNER